MSLPGLLHKTSLFAASTLDLTCLGYELFFETLTKAIHSDSHTERVNKTNEALSLLLYLTEGLNLQTPIGRNLLSLYIYVQQLLLLQEPNPNHLLEALELMEKIGDAYFTLQQRQSHEPMENYTFQA